MRVPQRRARLRSLQMGTPRGLSEQMHPSTGGLNSNVLTIALNTIGSYFEK